ncbi:Lysine histidine transporter 1 [Abeliophyllum distichum]|uniref:Lysine histidine transporter 1 n=1 Tax=Abeliophyllum distichum TaxID=126358 RepID=A0ABD1SXZ6_9LAMI
MKEETSLACMYSAIIFISLRSYSFTNLGNRVTTGECSPPFTGHQNSRGVHSVDSKLFRENIIKNINEKTLTNLPYSYSTIAWSASLHKGMQPQVEYDYPTKSTLGTVFDFFTVLGDVAFAYARHNIVLEIQGTIPSNTTEAIQETYVERSSSCLYHHCLVLFPHRPDWLRGVWKQSRG